MFDDNKLLNLKQVFIELYDISMTPLKSQNSSPTPIASLEKNAKPNETTVDKNKNKYDLSNLIVDLLQKSKLCKF